MTTNRSLESVEFSITPDPRCPCVLLLDTSGSMGGDPIKALNHSLQLFREAMAKDKLAARRAEVAVVTFNSSVQVAQDFISAGAFDPPTLTAEGLTHMGAGIHEALDLVRQRKAVYKANGVDYYRPWVFMITDGEPQGEEDTVVSEAIRRLREDEARKSVTFYAVGVQGANMDRLSQISVRPPLKLDGLKFVELFVWLSSSMQARTKSGKDEMVALPPTDGWSHAEA